MNEIPEKAKLTYEYITGGGEHLALTRTLFNGRETSSIVLLNKLIDGTYEIVPLAVLVNDEIIDLLEPFYGKDKDEKDMEKKKSVKNQH